MRYSDALAGFSIDTKICADDKPCDEYQVPSGNQNQRCWVSIKSGQALAVECVLETTAMFYQVDLIIDGVLRNTFLSSTIKHPRKRTAEVNFEQGIYKENKSLYQANLKTSILRFGM